MSYQVAYSSGSWGGPPGPPAPPPGPKSSGPPPGGPRAFSSARGGSRETRRPVRTSYTSYTAMKLWRNSFWGLGRKTDKKNVVDK